MQAMPRSPAKTKFSTDYEKAGRAPRPAGRRSTQAFRAAAAPDPDEKRARTPASEGAALGERLTNRTIRPPDSDQRERPDDHLLLPAGAGHLQKLTRGKRDSVPRSAPHYGGHFSN